MASRVIAAIRHSAVLAAALSFFLPGLGQGWAGARRRAIIMAAPIMLVAGIGLLVVPQSAVTHAGAVRNTRLSHAGAGLLSDR